jgi:putative heme-binding domain-containing protein
LARTPEGAEAVLGAAEAGSVSAYVLADEAVRSSLAGSGLQGWEGRAGTLTAGLPSTDARLAARVAERREKLRAAGGDSSAGAAVFSLHCGICHQIAGAGNVVGPQLDGIGNRGLDRLVEDVLDPNRNIDHAFRLSTMTLRDGSTKAGLFRREEGATLVFADTAGQEFALRNTDIDRRETLNVSLMPAIYADALSDADFADLIAYLLTVK